MLIPYLAMAPIVLTVFYVMIINEIVRYAILIYSFTMVSIIMFIWGLNQVLK